MRPREQVLKELYEIRKMIRKGYRNHTILKKEDILINELKKTYEIEGFYRQVVLIDGLKTLICWGRGCGDCANCYGEDWE